MAIYTPNVPQGNQQISATQGPIQGNFQYLQATLTKDHEITSLNSATAIEGYHKVVHLTAQAVPATIASITQVYSRVAGSDTQLFVKNSAGQISRLTGHSAAASGYQYMGGIIIQWGNTLTSASTTVSFPNATAFTNCWVVLATPVFSGAVTPSTYQNIGIRSVSATNFVWTFQSEGNIMPSFNWIAIGS
jgi:hypothetical protein